jgi:hypothetical protein
MEVNGRQVDALQWLRETGGKNAIKRFARQPDDEATQSQKPTDKVTLSTEAALALKAQMQYTKAGVVAPSGLAGIYAGLAKTTPSPGSPPADSVRDSSTNAVQFNTTDANSADVNGAHNAVDFRSRNAPVRNNTVTVTGDGNLVRGYNGGQKNNTITVTGDSNQVYAGENVSNTAVAVRGGENTVNLATDASNNSVAVTGTNVKVSIGSAGQNAGSNQNWTVSVAADDVDVAIVNGKAEVKLSEEQQEKYKVTVDNAAKTVSVIAA